MAADPPWSDLDERVLFILRTSSADLLDIVEVWGALGRHDVPLGEVADALHRLEKQGFSEMVRIPDQYAAFHRLTVTTTATVPVDLDALTGASQ